MAAERVSRDALATLLNVSPQAVSKAVAAERIRREDDGTFEIPEAIEAFRANGGGHGAETGRFGGPKPDEFGPNGAENGRSGANSMASEGYYRGRAVRETYRAKRERLLFERDSGVLLNAETVRREVFEAFRAFRDAMEAIPERMDGALAAESDPAKCRQMLRTELRKALADLEAFCRRQAGAVTDE